MLSILHVMIDGLAGLRRPGRRKEQVKPGKEKPESPNHTLQNGDSQNHTSEEHGSKEHAPESPAVKAEIPIDVKRSTENIYLDTRVVRLAKQCKMGDVGAMKEMAAFFRGRCTTALIELLDQYEANPTGEGEKAIDVHIKKHYHEETTVGAYMMWMVRAALYGDAESQQKLEAWPFYKKRSYLSYDMLTGKDGSYMSIWASSFLWRIGLIDVPSGYEDCGIRFDSENRYFDFYYVSDYEPPDEEGFGAEWEYEHIYFDEYFCWLPVKNESDIPEAMKKINEERLRCKEKGS